MNTLAVFVVGIVVGIILTILTGLALLTSGPREYTHPTPRSGARP